MAPGAGSRAGVGKGGGGAMNLCLAVFCLSLSGLRQGSSPRDGWFAEDKWRHLFTSFAVTTLAVSAARTAGMERETSVWVGASVGFGAGVAKEIADLRTPGASPSAKDLFWDAAGVGAGVAVVVRGR